MEEINKLMENNDITQSNQPKSESIVDDFRKKLANISSEFDGSKTDVKAVFAKKIIGVYGVHTGVGVSSVVSELAVLFAKSGHKTLIMDGNLYNPYHRIHYINRPTDKSFIDSTTAMNIIFSDLFVESKIHKNINYCKQYPIDAQAFVSLEEKFSIYQKIINDIHTIANSFDVVIIDLDTHLLTSAIEQAFLKSCRVLIEVKDNDIRTVLNEKATQNNIKLTKDNEVKILEIYNKSNTSQYCLPLEPLFNESYSNGKSFLQDGKSDTDSYKKQLENFYIELVKEMNI